MIENHQAKMTRFLVKNTDVFDQRKVVIVDVGARYGCNPLWENTFGDYVNQIGFEPDAEEFRRLNEGKAKRNTKNSKYFSVALHKDKGKRRFFVTNYAAASGFYRPKASFWNRFQAEVSVQINDTMLVETVDFDSFSTKQGIEYADFLKIDVEGAELDVLKGCKKFLLKGVVLGALVEVRFQNSSNQPTFAETDQFMRSLGFKLFDLDCTRKTRKTLSHAPVAFNNTVVGWGVSKGIGQVFAGDALYFRDAVAELSSDQNRDKWNDTSILKLACFYELFGLPDCAIELLNVARGRNMIKTTNIDQLIELLTPKFDGEDVSYRQYIERINTEYLQKVSDRYKVRLMPIILKDVKLIVNTLKYRIISFLPPAVKQIMKQGIKMLHVFRSGV